MLAVAVTGVLAMATVGAGGARGTGIGVASGRWGAIRWRLEATPHARGVCGVLVADGHSAGRSCLSALHAASGRSGHIVYSVSYATPTVAVISGVLEARVRRIVIGLSDGERLPVTVFAAPGRRAWDVTFFAAALPCGVEVISITAPSRAGVRPLVAGSLRHGASRGAPC